MWALIQWHRFLLSVQELSVVWEQDGVQWVTEWKMWRMAQQDSVGEEPGERGESWRQQQARWVSGGGVDSAGVVLRERSSRNAFTYIWATPPPPSSSHYSQPQGWTASLVFPWQQSLNLVQFAAAVQALPVVTHQVHITKSFHDGCFYSHFSCVPTEVLVCGEHTHLNNLSDRSGWDLRLTVWIEAGLPPRWAPRGLDLVPQWRSHNFTSSFFIWCYFAVT